MLPIYFIAWWLVFWLPMRKIDPLKFLAFIPTALFAFGIPLMVSDLLLSTPKPFLIAWTIIPIVLTVLMLYRERKITQQAPAEDPLRGSSEA